MLIPQMESSSLC